jgi:hypothetical protein
LLICVHPRSTFCCLNNRETDAEAPV